MLRNTRGIYRRMFIGGTFGSFSQLMSVATKRSGCGNLAPELHPKSFSASAGLHRWGLPAARRAVVRDYYYRGFIPRDSKLHRTQESCVRSGARIE